MNQRRIPVTLVNPFDYLNFLENHTNSIFEPTPLTSARQAELDLQAEHNTAAMIAQDIIKVQQSLEKATPTKQ